ncbi:MAG: hypothetical protein M3N08_07880 [Pseudomonadota bacterium]|nr:hypothetical protein [Pseudomonadota bacterium]
MARKKYPEGIQSVFDFYWPRSWKGGVAFYLFHVVALAILLAVVGKIVFIVMADMDAEKIRQVSMLAGEVVAVLYCTTLYSLILYARRTWMKPLYIAGIILTVVLSLFKGGLLGVIPAALTLCLKAKRRMSKEMS